MLELSHIYKTFNQGTIDEKVLFSDFNITVNDGDFVGVIGSNGSGKTTMLNVISGDMPIDSGSVFSWRYADRVSGSDDLFGLYAADPDFWADPRGISGRFHSGVLPWIQHVVFQRWYLCQHLSFLCCADFSRI